MYTTHYYGSGHLTLLLHHHPPQQQQQQLHQFPCSLLLILPSRHHHYQCEHLLHLPPPAVAAPLVSPLHLCRSRRWWDPNAESFKTQNFNEYNGDIDDEGDDDVEQWTQVLEDYVDSIWIFKVFGSYGWMLPVILLSLLFATGLKAFLMALALPLGQSTVSFVLQRLWGKRRKHKSKTKRRSRARTSRTFGLEEEEMSSKRTKRKRVQNQPWFRRKDIGFDQESDDAPNFGGWDELDQRTGPEIGSAKRPTQSADETQQIPMEKRKLSRRDKTSDTPLLLRLLIAVFPFLGSWINML